MGEYETRERKQSVQERSTSASERPERGTNRAAPRAREPRSLDRMLAGLTNAYDHLAERAADMAPLECERAKGATCVAAALEIAPQSVRFPQTRVGESSLQSVRVRNPNARVAAIDDVRIFESGIGDFHAPGLNAMLPAAGEVTMPLLYRPSGEGRHTGFVQVFERAGVASPQVELVGEAVESRPHRTHRLAQLVDSTVEAKGTVRTFRRERAQAEKAVIEWRSGVDKLTTLTANWMSNNWTRFLSDCGGDYSVHWTEGHFDNVVGDFLSGIAGALSANPVLEFTLATLTSLVYDAILTRRGNHDDEGSAYKNVRQTGRAIESKHRQFQHHAQVAFEHAQAMFATAVHRIYTAKTKDEIGDLDTWARRELAALAKLPDEDDLSLHRELLRDWVRERAGTATTRGKHTNGPAYTAARRSAFGLRENEALAQRDLFVFQARHDWARLGLAGIDAASSSLMNKVEALEAQAGTLVGSQRASFVANMLGKQVAVSLDVPDPILTSHAFAQEGVLVRHDKLVGKMITCFVALRPDHGSVSASFFQYYADGSGYVGTRRPI